MRAGLEVFSDIYILCLMLMAIPVMYRKFTKYLLFAFFYIIGLIDMLCYQMMGIALVPTIVQTWLQTNRQEAGEAITVYLSPHVLFSPLLLMLLLPLLLYTVKRIQITIPRFLIAVLFWLILASALYGINNKRYLYSVYTRVSDDDMEEQIGVESMTHEYLPVYRLLLSVKEISRFSTMKNHLLHNVKHTAVDSCLYTSPRIVLIIGESYNRHHASLYGYPKQTTPMQDHLYRLGRLQRFNDVISSYNLTYKSFQNMLTLYNYDSKGKWYDYPILPAVFKKAGYEVDFFSNQNTLDKASAFTDYTEDVFMNNPEITSYMFDKRDAHSHSYDMELIDDYLSMSKTATNRNQLIIFHFIGIHADFKLRYPQERKVFHASDYKRADLSSDEKETLADYDNAIYYNDMVVGNIIKTFDNQEAIIIYVPDHGELVYDNCQEMGRNLSLEKKYIVPQFDIPFWIYCTDSYRDNHSDIWLKIERAKDRPFMTDDLPHLLLFLAGITSNGYSPERNIIDDRFDVNRKRYIKGEADYDVICK
jgi:heptose-I-phosphate ethanolaminephosphotransferase